MMAIIHMIEGRPGNGRHDTLKKVGLVMAIVPVKEGRLWDGCHNIL